MRVASPPVFIAVTKPRAGARLRPPVSATTAGIAAWPFAPARAAVASARKTAGRTAGGRSTLGGSRTSLPGADRMDTPGVHEANSDQAAYWNGAAGQRWINRQDTLDLVLKPIQDELL